MMKESSHPDNLLNPDVVSELSSNLRQAKDRDSIGNKAPDNYAPFCTLLDRLLIRRVKEDIGSEGFVVPEKFRQSECWGTVEAVGQCVVLGGVRYPLTDFVNVGDLVKYGEHVAEQFSLTDEDLFIVRVQDLRGLRARVDG